MRRSSYGAWRFHHFYFGCLDRSRTYGIIAVDFGIANKRLCSWLKRDGRVAGEPCTVSGVLKVGKIKNSSSAHPWLSALGGADLPASVTFASERYEHRRTFKHDFFAATGLYESAAQKRIVVKIGRVAPAFGIPLRWIGRILTDHESRLYQLAQGIPGVPEFTGRFGATGLAHAYIEGRPLAKGDVPPDDFFPRLAALLEALHEREAAYVDLEKRENVLLGEDGRPYLIDFQISWHVPANRGGRTDFFRMIRGMLQSSDRYHLYKHWRRMRPDQLQGVVAARFGRPPLWIRWHRAIFRPLTLIRRQVLVWLGERSSIRVRSPG